MGGGGRGEASGSVWSVGGQGRGGGAGGLVHEIPRRRYVSGIKVISRD